MQVMESWIGCLEKEHNTAAWIDMYRLVHADSRRRHCHAPSRLQRTAPLHGPRTSCGQHLRRPETEGGWAGSCPSRLGHIMSYHVISKISDMTDMRLIAANHPNHPTISGGRTIQHPGIKYCNGLSLRSFSMSAVTTTALAFHRRLS